MFKFYNIYLYLSFSFNNKNYALFLNEKKFARIKVIFSIILAWSVWIKSRFEKLFIVEIDFEFDWFIILDEIEFKYRKIDSNILV